MTTTKTLEEFLAEAAAHHEDDLFGVPMSYVPDYEVRVAIRAGKTPYEFAKEFGVRDGYRIVLLSERSKH